MFHVTQLSNLDLNIRWRVMNAALMTSAFK